jgi:hypothetical protein
MKLGQKLLVAPAWAAVVVVLAASQADAYLLLRAAGEARALFQQRVEGLRAVTGVQDRLERLHAGVSRAAGDDAPLGDGGARVLRRDLAHEADDVRRVLDALRDVAPANDELHDAVETTIRQVDQYQREADTALEWAAVDPAKGRAALPRTQTAFAATATGLGALATRIERVSTEGAAAAHAASARSHRRLEWLAFGAVGAAVWLSWLLQRRGTDPARDIVHPSFSSPKPALKTGTDGNRWSA